MEKIRETRVPRSVAHCFCRRNGPCRGKLGECWGPDGRRREAETGKRADGEGGVRR